MTDNITGRRFLVDTGAQVSVIPATQLDKHTGTCGPPLLAANGSNIATYGMRIIPIRTKDRVFTARFVVADVKRPLLGADFLRRHNLLVNVRGLQVINADSLAIYPCSTHRVANASIQELVPVAPQSNKFRKVLSEFPQILQPTFSSSEVKHGVHHHVPTTGPPIHAKARRLAPDKLATAKEEFKKMEDMGARGHLFCTWSLKIVETGDHMGIFVASTTGR
ncbi:uncharacterized protein LOC106012155 [Aplysia californica]|uniref:Uncharacterized protein LOC106012155 n=1 Tax=Aplysia californica TaxID=6500 RepID=A0ABM1A2Q0_APLCA|nr:uncharacterized protein LOC106012155 [Aplysia californica]